MAIIEQKNTVFYATTTSTTGAKEIPREDRNIVV
jgi:hypothetical protein